MLRALQWRALVEVLPMLQLAHDLAGGAQHNWLPVTPRLFIADGFRCAVFERGGPHIKTVNPVDVDPVYSRAHLNVTRQDQRWEIPLRVPAFNISLASLLACPLVLGEAGQVDLIHRCRDCHLCERIDSACHGGSRSSAWLCSFLREMRVRAREALSILLSGHRRCPIYKGQKRQKI